MNPETGRIHGVSPHKLRDAFAVHAMKLNDSGDGMRLLQEHLGHAEFQYHRQIPESIRHRARRLVSETLGRRQDMTFPLKIAARRIPPALRLRLVYP